MAKIVVLTEVYFPESASTSHLLTQTAEGLAEEFSVEVITGPASKFLSTIDYDNTSEMINRVRVVRCGGTRFDKNKILGRVANVLTRSLSIFWQALSSCRSNDVLLAVTSPPTLPFVALALQILKGTRYVVLLHDVYPEVLHATGLLNKKSILSHAILAANKVLYRRATRIIAIGRDMAQLVAHKLGRDIEKIVIIPNWADSDLAPRPKSESLFAIQNGFDKKFSVLYAGNLSRANAVETIAEAARLLKDDTEIVFTIIGFGAKKEWLEKYVVDNKLKNVVIFPPMPREQQMNFLNSSDVALATLIPNMTGVSVPSRTYSFLAVGRPILALCEPGSELGCVVQEEGAGWVVPPDDAETLAGVIREASKSPETVLEMSRRAAQCAQSKYSRASAIHKYRELMRAVMS
jgi:glycosyltransferase involved in cell wall biosynthesis